MNPSLHDHVSRRMPGRDIWYRGIPAFPPALFRRNSKPGQPQTFRNYGLLAGDGLRRFACNAATPNKNFTGRFSIKGLQGTNIYTAGIHPVHPYDTTGAGEPARQAAAVGLLTWMGGSCACPLAETLAGARNMGGTDATGTAEEGSGGK
jgi:hypothetical protein